jgi:hypothetical protein
MTLGWLMVSVGEISNQIHNASNQVGDNLDSEA